MLLKVILKITYLVDTCIPWSTSFIQFYSCKRNFLISCVRHDTIILELWTNTSASGTFEFTIIKVFTWCNINISKITWKTIGTWGWCVYLLCWTRSISNAKPWCFNTMEKWVDMVLVRTFSHLIMRSWSTISIYIISHFFESIIWRSPSLRFWAVPFRIKVIRSSFIHCTSFIIIVTWCRNILFKCYLFSCSKF